MLKQIAFLHLRQDNQTKIDDRNEQGKVPKIEDLKLLLARRVVSTISRLLKVKEKLALRTVIFTMAIFNFHSISFGLVGHVPNKLFVQANFERPKNYRQEKSCDVQSQSVY